MKINKKKFPQHVGIIMDGNGRWALKRGFSRLFGHEKGIEAVKKSIDYAIKIGLKVLTLFAFSTENWQRNQEEIDGIFKIIEKYLEDDFEEYKIKDVKIRTMGDLTKLPQKLQESINNCKISTQNNNGLIVNVAINYGARDEIIKAVNKLIKSNKKEIQIGDFNKSLYTFGLPDPDLIIRTSGEMRLSNFMLFQSAYSELYFIKTFWPSFNARHFKKAINSYLKRDRRYGGNHRKIK